MNPQANRHLTCSFGGHNYVFISAVESFSHALIVAIRVWDSIHQSNQAIELLNVQVSNAGLKFIC